MGPYVELCRLCVFKRSAMIGPGKCCPIRKVGAGHERFSTETASFLVTIMDSRLRGNDVLFVDAPLSPTLSREGEREAGK